MRPPSVLKEAGELEWILAEVRIVDPAESPLRAESTFRNSFACGSAGESRSPRRRELINNPNIFGSMMLHMGDADVLVAGVTQHFPDTIRPALQIVRMREGLHKVSGCYPLVTRKRVLYFLADTYVYIEPTAEELVEIALTRLTRWRVALTWYRAWLCFRSPVLAARRIRSATGFVKR